MNGKQILRNAGTIRHIGNVLADDGSIIVCDKVQNCFFVKYTGSFGEDTIKLSHKQYRRLFNIKSGFTREDMPFNILLYLEKINYALRHYMWNYVVEEDE